MHTRYKDMSWLISCAAHTMKRVTFSLKKLNLDDATYTYVSFCFSLLLNATTLDSASQLYRHICIILLTPTVTSEVEAAKHKIREALAQRVESYVSREAPERTLILNAHTARKIMIGEEDDFQHYDFTDVDCVAGPLLVNDNHWTLFFVNLLTKDFIFIDPRGSNALTEHQFQQWCSFAASHSLGSRWQLELVQFTRQAASDVANCGVYVALFLSRLVNMSLDLYFENTFPKLHALRMEMSRKLKTI